MGSAGASLHRHPTPTGARSQSLAGVQPAVRQARRSARLVVIHHRQAGALLLLKLVERQTSTP